jgi:transglutaminase-like putative cysteine protease
MNITKIWQSDGEEGIKQTLKHMRELVIATDANRVIKQKAREIISGIRPNDEMGQIAAIFNWVRSHMEYVRDIYGVEELTAPDKIVTSMLSGTNEYSSDCDDYAMLLSALLRAVGFRTRLEALAVGQPEGYDHARAAVFVKTLNKWIPLEGTKPNVAPGFGLKSQKPILALEAV